MSPERHEKSERRPPVSWRPWAGVQQRSSVHLANDGDLSCLSAIRDNLLLCLWPSKRKRRHCGESTGKSDQDSVTKYHQFRSVVVYSNTACSCWFLESASEVKQRENDEKLKSLVHYIVFCGKQNILLRGHPNEKVNQARVSRLSSASDGPGIVLVDKEAGSPGNSIALLSFKPKLMMLLYWGIFIAILIDREENKSSIFHPRSRMSGLTAEEKP